MGYRESQKKNKQCPKFEREELVELIWLKLIEGESRYRILLMLERDAFVDQDGNTIETSKMSRTSKYDFIKEAYTRCETELKENRDKQREILWERIMSVYQDAMTQPVHDRGAALKALDMIGKLAGLYDAEKHEINATVDSKVTISFGFDNNNE